MFNSWLLCNSTYVINTAFFLGGYPKGMVCYHKGDIECHPSGSIYSGVGISESGALFSYQANWQVLGHWVVEILTNKHHLYFKPMATLQIHNMGSVKVEPIEIDDHLDNEFKVGFYLQTKAFLEGDYTRLPSINEQSIYITIYNKISGYAF